LRKLDWITWIEEESPGSYPYTNFCIQNMDMKGTQATRPWVA